MVTLHEVITFLVSMQISISSLQTHNVNRCGRSRHLARKLSLRRKRSSPNVFEMAATETITSIILIKLIRVSLGTVRHPRRFKIVVIDIQITLKQMLRDFIGIRVNRAKKSGMVNITSSVNSRERSGINTILHELNPLFTINVTMRDIKVKMSTVESIARPRRNGERRRAPTASISKESPAITGALASIKLIQASAVLDLTEDDFDFLTSNKVWIATDRSRARRCVEACVYGTLDFVGYPRFPAPVEFIAAVIAYYVHPVNIQTACLIMEGAEFTENIINGVERPVKAAELFAFTLRVRAGNTDVLTDAEENVRQKLRAEGVM